MVWSPWSYSPASPLDKPPQAPLPLPFPLACPEPIFTKCGALLSPPYPTPPPEPAPCSQGLSLHLCHKDPQNSVPVPISPETRIVHAWAWPRLYFISRPNNLKLSQPELVIGPQKQLLWHGHHCELSTAPPPPSGSPRAQSVPLSAPHLLPCPSWVQTPSHPSWAGVRSSFPMSLHLIHPHTPSSTFCH